MLTAIAIDDEPLALEIIKNLAEQVSYLHMEGFYTKAVDALTLLQKQEIDLLFLDIRMPDITGIDFIRALPRKPMVIFTTAYSEHAVQSFELDAIDYLLKPFSLPRFLKACNKACELSDMKKRPNVPAQAKSSVFIKSGYGQVRVDLHDILFVESMGNYVQFVLPDRNVVSRLTMNDAADLLPGDTFIRIHRCYLAAKNQITKIDKKTAWLGGKELPIGEFYLPDLEKFLNNP